MRERKTSGALTVQAIAGSHVVILAMSVEADARSELMGFAIERRDGAGGEKRPLPNFLLFEANGKDPKPDHSSLLNPLQAFQWCDYTAAPGCSYAFTVTAMHGKPGNLEAGDSVKVEVETEDTEKGKHAVFFNRGAAGWQAYEREFGERDPDQVSDRAAYRWLSRGLEEALLAFIAQADGKGWGLRMAIYEFDYVPVLDALWSAKRRGVDVKVVVDERTTVKSPPAENKAAIEVADIDSFCIPRLNTGKIPHNKFIVLLKDGKPREVWTGSTNVTKGGIFGHSNVGHLVRDEDVAGSYLDYWKELSGDPEHEALQTWTVKENGQPEELVKADDQQIAPPPDSIGTVFSPRQGIEALEWYAKLMDRAEQSAFLTCPFGVSKQLEEVFAEDKPYLRYLMLDNEDGEIKTAARKIEGDPDNLVAVGAYLGQGNWHQWLKEHLTGFNNKVRFIHTKYMLIDPLGDDPIVITGSANFSESSTKDNDENMLVIRGDKALADVYLGEFMRLFSAFRLRKRAGVDSSQPAPGPGVAPKDSGNVYLSPDPSWADRFYVEDSPEEKERLLFSGLG
jgi:phosphatidylserine/phosphatidylglycerophosphate/cardiolipin synthase-like enzyme